MKPEANSIDSPNQSFLLIRRIVLAFIIVSFSNTVYLAATSSLNEDELRLFHQGMEFAHGYTVFEEFNAIPSVPCAALASWCFRFADNRFTGIFWGRSLSVLFYMASCLLLFAICSILFTRQAGLFTLFSWLSLGFVIIISHEFRPIHPTLFFSLASIYLFLRYKVKDVIKKQWLFFSGMAAAMAFLFKPDAIVIVVAVILVQFVSCLRFPNREGIKDFLLPCAGIGIVFCFYFASFNNLDRIVRYLFFQYDLLIFVNSIPESGWDWPSVARFEFLIPFSIAALLGIPLLISRLWAPKGKAILTFLLILEVTALASLFFRPVKYSQNFFYPSIVPALLAGIFFDRSLRIRNKRMYWIAMFLIISMATCVIASSTLFEHFGQRRNIDLFHQKYEETFSSSSRCSVSISDIMKAEELFREKRSSYRLSLQDHHKLFDFLGSIEGNRLVAYDGFEAATPIRGAPYLNGFVLSAFRGEKYQRIYEFIRDHNGFSGKILKRAGWKPFQDMRFDDAKEALVCELIHNPPDIVIMDSFIWMLVNQHSRYADFLDMDYSFVILHDAHSIVGVRSGRAFIPPQSTWCSRY